MDDHFFMEEPVDLKEAINIQDLQDPNKGAQFEVDVSNVKPESEFNNSVFPGEDVYANILHVDEETSNLCDREGLDTFEVLQRNMEDITETQDGGVFKQVLKHGAGITAPPGALVRIHYNAYHEMEAEPFDSTRLRHQVEKFRLGLGSQVEGMHVAVGSMKKGERSRFIFKPEYFFGKMGCPPRIPPNCTVLFDIELLSFVEREGVDDYHQMTEEERKKISFDFVCKVAKAEREEGNQLYNAGLYNKAWTKYKQAGKILEDYHLKNEAEEEQQKKVLVRVYINMALCCQKLKQNGITITYCNKALALNPHNVKAIYHKAQALHFMSEFEDARNLYLKAQRLDSANKAIASALRKLDQDMKKFAIQSESYKKMCERMVSSSVSDSGGSNTEASPQEEEKEGDQCSLRFRTTVEQKIQEFYRNPDIVEMPFPELSLTVPEISASWRRLNAWR
ncbi:inactive peptidyl-prolyl cis-trans isomerase FKBP6-like isoform X2 [Babylonia areolata]|uniref:inactive peptidyl-prolyl cis-trans isomerase FKBP6-like isoform X2 n=1 Tax=Babylonia areolata TaxID=304850 RepID=UPI003FD3811B